MRDLAVSSVLGTVLMLALMMTLIPGVILMRAAVSDEMDAQREAAARAAFCARNPAIGPPTCQPPGPLPGYECQQAEVDVWVCTRPLVPTAGNVSVTPAPTPPTATPTAPTVGI